MRKNYFWPLLASVCLVCCALCIGLIWLAGRSGELDSPLTRGMITGSKIDGMRSGPFLSAAFATIQSGCRLASFHAQPPDEPTPIRASSLRISPHNEIEDVLASLESSASKSVSANGVSLGNGDRLYEGIIDNGDTLANLFASLGISNSDAYVRAIKRVLPLKSFRAGQPWRAIVDRDSGMLTHFECEIDDTRRLVAEGEDKPRARMEDLDFTVVLDRIEGVIDDNLFQAIDNIGEHPQLALSLVNLFGSEINFVRNLRKGDSFTVLVEKNFRNGEYRGYGRIMAARFINRGHLHEAYLFRDEMGRAQYYNAMGENIHKALLQAPLDITRMTSRFSESRLHPILNVARPHYGVDYAAPTGTPVKAVGDGTVTELGWSGGYGNLLVVRHSATLESLYAHLSGFAKGMKVGEKVRQGQVIGYVGSTGLATGPHLDFRLRQKGEFINPEKAVNPRAAPVSANLRDEFTKVLAMERSALDGERKFENYSPESMVPPALASFKPLPEPEYDQRIYKGVRWSRNALLERMMAARRAAWSRAMAKRRGRVTVPAQNRVSGVKTAKKKKRR